VPEGALERFPTVAARAVRFLHKHPNLVGNIHPIDQPGHAGRHLLAVCNQDKLRQILARMLDEERFLSPYGIRSLSRWHLEHPYEFLVHGERYEVKYVPGESETGMFGGNSNWRGPIWFPVNLMIINALMQYYLFYGDSFRIECPTGSGQTMNLWQVAQEICRRLMATFLRGADGKRPVYGSARKFQEDPHWRDLILFYEYFHGDSGLGLGASHQTGWTGIVARLARLLHSDAAAVLESGLTKLEHANQSPG
jgi:hypothetical protein